jgi:hypothetical protein
LNNKYAEGVIECLVLFTNILGFHQAPKAFQIPHCRIWGEVRTPRAGDILFGPLVLYNLMYNDLKYIKNEISSMDKEALKHYDQAAKSETQADIEGEYVFAALKQDIMTRKPQVK